MENIRTRFKLSLLSGLLLLTLTACPIPYGGSGSLLSTLFKLDPYKKSTHWTILYYVDGDNDLEGLLLEDLEELSQGLSSSDFVNVIALVDRIDGYSTNTTILGSNFTDTRLFRIGANEIYPIPGEEYFPDISMTAVGEYNMGDARTLKKFIEYGKKYYPADHYGLIFSNHGSGVRSYSGSDPADFVKGGSGLSSESFSLLDKSIAYDETSSNDSIYTAELTDVLDSRHSVDLLVYDACLMGLVEIAYQYRPGVAGEFSADYMVASAPNVWGYGYPYDRVFSRLASVTGENGRTSTVTGTLEDLYNYSPADLTPERLGRIFVEEQKEDTNNSNSQVLALFDLSQVQNVVSKLNLVAADLDDDGEATLDTIRGHLLDYSADPIGSPHYDLYEFAQDTTGSVGAGLRTDLLGAVDDMVLASFGDFAGFDEGSDGLGFFFPNGDVPYGTQNYWYQQDYYTGEDLNAIIEGRFYGKLDFCSADNDGTVDSWFELLQKFYNPYNPQGTPAEQANYDQFHPGRF